MDNQCESCNQKKNNNDPNLHCYMFKDQPSFNCMQHSDFDSIRKGITSEEHIETILKELGILHGDQAGSF